jgi:hypothetical protein
MSNKSIRTQPSTDVWEYTNSTAEADSPALLNSMGADGWELVSVIPEVASRVTFYFKRRKRS